MDGDRILAEVTAIESILKDSTKGWANTTAKSDIERRLWSIEHASGVGHGVGEKVASIRAWIEILFSARKHTRYGGPDKVELFIRHDLASLSMIARRSAV